MSRALVRLPVTTAIWVAQDAFLVGEGPILRFFVESAQQWELQALERQRIHRVVIAESSAVVLGGNELAIVQLDAPKVTARSRPSDWLLNATFLPRSIAVVTAHNVVILLDRTGATQRRIECDEQPLLWSAAFSQSSFHTEQDLELAGGSIEQTVLLWRPFDSTKPYKRLSGHQGSVFNVSWSPDRRRLCTLTDERILRIWTLDAEDSRPLQLWGHTVRPWRSVWLADDRLATSDEAGAILVWQLSSNGGTITQRIQAHEGRHCWALGADSDGRKIISGGADSALCIWPVGESNEELLMDGVRSFGVSKDGSTALAITVDGEAVILDLRGRAAPQTIHCSELLLPSATVVLDEEGRTAWVISKARHVLKFDLSSPHSSPTISDLNFAPAAAQLHKNRLIVHDLSTATVRLLDLESLRALNTIAVTGIGSVSAMQLAADEQTLVVGSTKGEIRVYSLKTGAVIASQRISGLTIVSLATSIDSFESTTADGRHYRHTVDGSELFTSLVSVIGRCETHLLDLDGQRALGMMQDGRLILKLPSGQELCSFACSGNVRYWRLVRTDSELVLISVHGTSVRSSRVPWLRGPPTVPRAPICGREIRSLVRLTFPDQCPVVAIGCEYGVLRILALRDSSIEPMFTHAAMNGSVTAMHAAGSQLIAATSSGNLHAFNVRQVDDEMRVTEWRQRPSSRSEHRITACDRARDVLVTAHSHGLARIYLIDGQAEVLTWIMDVEREYDVRCALSTHLVQLKDKLVLLVGFTDGSVRCSSVDTNSKAAHLRATLSLHQSGVNAIVATPRDNEIELVTAGDDGALALSRIDVNRGTWRLLSTVPLAHASSVTGLSMLDDGRLTSCSSDGRVGLWRVANASLELCAMHDGLVADAQAVCSIDAGRLAVAGIGIELHSIE